MDEPRLTGRQRLVAVLAALCRRLPGQVGPLLDDPRRQEARAPLVRLADPRWAQQAAAAMTEAEAAWLAEALWQRWAAVGRPALEPAAWLELPEAVWVASAPVRVPFALGVVGVEAGWSVRWTGPVVPGEPPALLIAPPRPGEPWLARLQATVHAQLDGQSVQLRARGEVPLRRPVVTLDPGGTHLSVADQAGIPAAGVRIHVGEQEHHTGPDGCVQLSAPAPIGAPLRIAGLLVGLVPVPESDEPTLEIRRS